MPQAFYRRKLPHLQVDDKPHFVTFCTYQRWVLPARVRSLVLESCLHDYGRKLDLKVAVVMPDHVHLIFTPLIDYELWKSVRWLKSWMQSRELPLTKLTRLCSVRDESGKRNVLITYCVALKISMRRISMCWRILFGPAWLMIGTRTRGFGRSRM